MFEEIPIIEEIENPEEYLIRKEDGTLVRPEDYYKERFEKGKILVNPFDERERGPKQKIRFDL